METVLTNFDYYLHQCILQGWRNVGYAIRAWGRFITSDYRDYNYFENWTEEEKEENVRFDFWDALEDDIIDYGTYSYLRSISQELDNIKTDEDWEEWKIKTGVVPFTQTMADRLTELVGDVEVDLNDTLDVFYGDD